jgi:PAS domain S-box-containing protein
MTTDLEALSLTPHKTTSTTTEYNEKQLSQKLEHLSLAINEIMRHLGHRSPAERLQLIVRYATSILNAEASSILLVNQSDCLTLEASYGYHQEKLQHGQIFKIESGPGTGLTGHIAYHGELFNAHGEALKRHPAVKGGGSPATISGHCASLLILPIKRYVEHDEKLVGLLRLENKRGPEGQSGPDIGFTAEDEHIGQLFADAVEAILDNAQWVASLHEKNILLEGLISSSPMGIVVNNRQGEVTLFNAGAQEIMGRDPQTVLGQSVATLYAVPAEAAKVGQMLQASPNGKITGYETAVHNLAGETIAIRLSATLLHNADGSQVGAVGFFEDTRPLLAARHRVELLLSASNLLAQAENLTVGLQALARLMVQEWGSSFCRILLLQEDKQTLRVAAAYPPAEKPDGLQWQPRLGEATAVSDWPRLDELLSERAFTILRQSGPQGGPILHRLARWVGLADPIETVLAVPLRTNSGVEGLLYVGQLSPQAELSHEQLELAKAIGEQTAVLVQRMRLYQSSQQREQLLVALDQASRHIRAVKETPKLLGELIRLAAQLADCTVGGLYINRPQLGQLVLQDTHNLPDAALGSIIQHGEGLLGQVALTGLSDVTNRYDLHAKPEAALSSLGFKTLIGLPLKQAGQVKAVLFVADRTEQHLATRLDIEILERFAAQAAIAWQTSQLLSREERTFVQLAILHRLSNYIQTTQALEKILHAILTGVTANYGLGFNRAALLLIDQTTRHLNGRMGIGHTDEARARADWEQDEREGMDSFDHYLNLLEDDALPPTPVGDNIRQLRLPLPQADNGADAFAQVLHDHRPLLLSQEMVERLPQPFINAFEPAQPLLIAPLLVQDEAIGLLVVDNKFTKIPISNEDVEMLLTFASTAAIAIYNTQLLVDKESAQTRLREAHQASNMLVSATDPSQVWPDIVKQASQVAQASGVRMLLIDPHFGEIRDSVSYGLGQSDGKQVRSHGLSLEAMRSKQPQIIADVRQTPERISGHFLERGILAAIGLPLMIEGDPIGVMWVYYDRPHYFTEAEVEALSFYVNQAAIAYDNARRIKLSEQIRQAAVIFAEVTSLAELSKAIIVHTCQIFDADWAALWSYDDQLDKFILNDSIAALPEGLWQEYQKREPRQGGTAETVMAAGWLGIHDINATAEYPFLGSGTQHLLNRVGVSSFQGMALTVSEEKLGVLYANYNRPHSFSERDRAVAQTFANHVAVALKKAKLLESIGKNRQMASVMTNMTTLAQKRLDDTLTSVVEGARAALACDATVLYAYAPERKQLIYPPKTSGVRRPKQVERYRVIPPDSIVFQVLAQDEPTVAEDVLKDALFRQSRFTREEEIAACVALPLQAEGNQERQGILFLNYRQQRRFTSDDLEQMVLFGKQAAVAIHNARLYDLSLRQANTLQALERAAHAVTSLLDLDEIFFSIARHAWELTSSYGETCFCHLGVVEGQMLNFQAIYPRQHMPKLLADVGNIDLSGERVGITGQAVLSQKPILVDDVSQHEHYINHHTKTRSELAVPITFNNEVIGVINLEHSRPGTFDARDERALATLAEYAAIAIHNAQLYRQQEKQTRVLSALYDAGRAVTSSLELDGILQQIVKQAWVLAGVDEQDSLVSYASLWLADDGVPTVAATYPDKELSKTKQRLQEEASANGRIGISGRVFANGQPALVEDVSQDPDYIPTHPATKSELAVPILSGEQVIGIINVESTRLSGFDQGDVEALTSLATQATAAIENARLYQKSHQREKVLAALNQAGQMITKSLNIDEILHLIAEQAISLTQTTSKTAAKYCTLATVRRSDGKLEFSAVYPPERLNEVHERVGSIDLSQGKLGITGRAFKSGQPQRVGDVTADQDYLLYDQSIRSALAVPILIGSDQVIGVITLEHEAYHAFTPDDQQAMESLAAQAAIALQNAASHEETRLLQQVTADWAGQLDKEDIIKRLMQAALELTNTQSGSLLFWNKTENSFRPAYTMDRHEFQARTYATSARPGRGYTQRIIESRQSLTITDARQNPDINPRTIEKGRFSLIGVPLVQAEQVFAVLYVHGQRPRQFTNHQVTLLETLASQASVALDKARQHEELKQTKGLVGARTALAWMGMASSTWRHSIEGDAIKIGHRVTLMQARLAQLEDETLLAELNEHLGHIEELSQRISNQPITPDFFEMELILVNDLIRERMGQLWQDDSYKGRAPYPVLKLDTTDHVRVEVSAEWLRQALDLLVDNAIDALANTADKRLEIETAVVTNYIHIKIRDNGCGMTPELVARLFTEETPIRPRRAGHLGKGLLMAQAIVQTYGGEVKVEQTAVNKGTTMLITLPIQQQSKT